MYLLSGPQWDPNPDDPSDPGVSAEAKSLVKGMPTMDVTRRLTAAQALAHPWFQKAPSMTSRPLSKSVTDNLSSFQKVRKVTRT